MHIFVENESIIRLPVAPNVLPSICMREANERTTTSEKRDRSKATQLQWRSIVIAAVVVVVINWSCKQSVK